MPTERPTDAPGSPIPGVIPEPARVQHDPPERTLRSDDPRTERDERRRERVARRGPAGERKAVTAPRRREPPAVRPSPMRLGATAVIVGLAAVLGELMSSSPGWLIGLAASVVSLALAAVVWSSRRLS